MYCKDLQAFNFFQKLMVYALVSIISDNPKKKLDQKQQRTPTDKEGDGNPEWNHEMKFEISEALVRDCEGIFIHFDLRHEGQYFGDKTIGIVQVPLKDLLEEPYGAVRFVNYQVKSPEGHPNGILNFSYKGNNRKCSDLVTNSSVNGISGFSNVHHHHHHHDLPETYYPSCEVPYPAPQEACYPPLATHYSTTPSQEFSDLHHQIWVSATKREKERWRGTLKRGNQKRRSATDQTRNENIDQKPTKPGMKT